MAHQLSDAASASGDGVLRMHGYYREEQPILLYLAGWSIECYAVYDPESSVEVTMVTCASGSL